MCCGQMKDTKLHIVGLEALEGQCAQLAQSDPTNPDYTNKAWFFMFCYKVLLCPKRYSHDWGACPYAHNNESARRRDPQRYNYSSCICPNTGKGECPHGVQCRYAHTLFEYWLHPARFRTQMCKAGLHCKRALCFFAHSPAELRQPEKTDGLATSSVVQLASAAAAMAAGPLPATFPACQVMDGTAGVPGLAINTACLDSSSSNVSCATQQPGSSPTALNDFSGDLGAGALGSNGNLQLTTAPVTAGLLAQIPQGALPAALLGGQYPAGSAAAAVSSGLVTSMPQLQGFLQQQQQHQQQQLVAGMAGMNFSTAPVLVVDQLQPSTAISNLVGHQGNGMPAATAGAVAAPIYSSVIQAMPGSAYVRVGPGAMMQQQPMMGPMVSMQQVYQQGAYQLPQGLQYAWM